MTVTEQLDSILPARVTRFELVSGVIPLLHAGGMVLEVNGAFVGQCGREVLWEEMESEDLAACLVKFEGQDLLAIESGLGWLHLDFSDGWFRRIIQKPHPT